MTKNLKITLLILFILQCFVACSFDLAHDEAYYWLFSKNLDWGYFDHPPFAAVLIRLFSFLPQMEISVRLGFIMAQFLSLFFIFKLTDKKNWLFATLLFFSFPLASFSGLFALPDMPLLLMSTIYLYFLKQYLEEQAIANILKLSVAIALLLYAKYHGVLLIFFTIVALPRLLFKPSFYVIAAISLLLFSPHIYWQISHEFVTLRYHFVERPSSVFSLKRSLEYIGIQTILVSLFCGPVLWWQVLKNKAQTEFDRVLKVISIGSIVFFFLSSISKRVEANWTVFITPAIILLVVGRDIWNKVWMQRMLYISFVIVVSARSLFLLSPELVPISRLKEFHGWKSWSRDIEKMCGDQEIVANTYQIASKLSYYLQRNIQSLNYQSRKNQFDIWRFDKDYQSDKVCYLTNKKEFSGPIVLTPEGKELFLVKDQSLISLYGLK